MATRAIKTRLVTIGKRVYHSLTAHIHHAHHQPITQNHASMEFEG